MDQFYYFLVIVIGIVIIFVSLFGLVVFVKLLEWISLISIKNSKKNSEQEQEYNRYQEETVDPREYFESRLELLSSILETYVHLKMHTQEQVADYNQDGDQQDNSDFDWILEYCTSEIFQIKMCLQKVRELELAQMELESLENARQCIQQKINSFEHKTENEYNGEL